MLDRLVEQPGCLLNARNRRQLLATLLINLICIAHGIGVSWQSPILRKIKSNNSPLDFKLSVTEVSWAGSALGLGAVAGNVLMGIILRVGSRLCLLFTSLPHSCLWILVYLSAAFWLASAVAACTSYTHLSQRNFGYQHPRHPRRHDYGLGEHWHTIRLYNGHPSDLSHCAVLTQSDKNSERLTLQDFLMPAAFRAYGSAIVLVIVNQFNGLYGRRILLIIFSGGVVISLTAFGLFPYYAQWYDLSEWSWVPLCFMSLYIFLGSIGLVGCFFVVLFKMFPVKIRSKAASVAIVVCGICVFMMLNILPLCIGQWGMSATMWSFAGITAFGFVFFLHFLKETKGKSMLDD